MNIRHFDYNPLRFHSFLHEQEPGDILIHQVGGMVDEPSPNYVLKCFAPLLRPNSRFRQNGYHKRILTADTCDIMIGREPTEGRRMHETGRFLDDMRPGISPTYIRRLPGCYTSSVSHPSKIEFAISLIIQHHNILWSIPFQAANPKVMVTYIYVVSLVMLCVSNSSNSCRKAQNPYNSSNSRLDFIR